MPQLASKGQRSGVLLNILHKNSPTTKPYLAPDANSVGVEKPWGVQLFNNIPQL